MRIREKNRYTKEKGKRRANESYIFVLLDKHLLSVGLSFYEYKVVSDVGTGLKELLIY